MRYLENFKRLKEKELTTVETTGNNLAVTIKQYNQYGEEIDALLIETTKDELQAEIATLKESKAQAIARYDRQIDGLEQLVADAMD